MITGKLDTGLITDGPKKLKELKFTDLFINCVICEFYGSLIFQFIV